MTVSVSFDIWIWRDTEATFHDIVLKLKDILGLDAGTESELKFELESHDQEPSKTIK
jgi:hypothetical protein